MNKEISVFDCTVKPSNQNAGECLHMQIEFKEEKRVIFTGAKTLIATAKKMTTESFPFTTTIVKEGERYEFS